MARSSVVVRRAGADDLAALAPLWEDLRAAVGAGLAVPVGSLDRLRDRLADPSGRSPLHLVVAWQGEVPVGVATMSLQDVGPWWEAPAVLVSLLHVRSGARHKGVGQALLAEAVTFAEQVGTDDVAANVPPQLRDANRFFARLGFTPYTTRRVASATSLRRRLSAEGRGRVVDLRLRQRSLRDRARAARLSGRSALNPPAAEQQ